MGIGIGLFMSWKMGFKPLGLGFGHLVWEKCQSLNLEIAFEHCEVRLQKKNDGIGLVFPLQDPQNVHQRIRRKDVKNLPSSKDTRNILSSFSFFDRCRFRILEVEMIAVSDND